MTNFDDFTLGVQYWTLARIRYSRLLTGMREVDLLEELDLRRREDRCDLLPLPFLRGIVMLHSS